MSIAQAVKLRELETKLEQQARELAELRQRIERIEAQRKPGRPPKNG